MASISSGVPPPLFDEPIDQFDLETYANSYKGLTKISRLKFIADRCKSSPLELEALRMAIDEAKKGENTHLYRELIENSGDRLGPSYHFDKEWVDSTDKKAALRHEKLEIDLQNYKTNSIKESIRMGLNDMGDYFYSRGELQEAFKFYVRTRDYCTTSKHIISMCLNVILVSNELGNFLHVSNYVQKAEQTPDVSDPIILAKLRAASALAHLETSKYKQAARKFVDTNFEIGNNFNDVIAPQDIAIYGGLCALATFDRSELKSKVIDSLSFRNFLELVPEMREVINDFYSSQYSSCLNRLKKLKPNLLLDIHIHDHIELIYSHIRSKALIQYTTPFISVDLKTMANAFDTSITSLEDELIHLIMENSVQARIDSHNKVLYAKHDDQRNVAFQQTIDMGTMYMRNVRSMLLRMNLIRNDLIIRNNVHGKLP